MRGLQPPPSWLPPSKPSQPASSQDRCATHACAAIFPPLQSAPRGPANNIQPVWLASTPTHLRGGLPFAHPADGNRRVRLGAQCSGPLAQRAHRDLSPNHGCLVTRWRAGWNAKWLAVGNQRQPRRLQLDPTVTTKQTHLPFKPMRDLVRQIGSLTAGDHRHEPRVASQQAWRQRPSAHQHHQGCHL